MEESKKETTRTMEPIPLNKIPANIKMPEHLTEEELRQEVIRLKNILVQAEKVIKELQNNLGLKRIELLFQLLSIGGFSEEVQNTARRIIAEDLWLIEVAEPEKKEE